MKFIIASLCLVCLASCSTVAPSLQEGPIELTGIASDLPDHSEKANCQGIIVQKQGILFKGDYKQFSTDLLGKRIKVAGVLKMRRLPMFIWDKTRRPNGPIPPGIPMPPGTDIEKESIYYVIEDPKWELNE